MIGSGFRKLFWGFLFILIDFRISGFDILPNFIGYILFAVGFSILAKNSIYFVKASNYNIVMILLSLFSIYQYPAQGSGIEFGPLGLFAIPVVIASVIFNLLVVYNLFNGIKDMAECSERGELYSEAETRWKQFLALQLTALIGFLLVFIPGVALVYIVVMFIFPIVVATLIMLFMTRCGERLQEINDENYEDPEV